MEGDVLQSVLEETENVYNIKHRAFYFAKDIVLFIEKQNFD